MSAMGLRAAAQHAWSSSTQRRLLVNYLLQSKHPYSFMYMLASLIKACSSTSAALIASNSCSILTTGTL